MEPDKTTPESGDGQAPQTPGASGAPEQAPADALSRTPEDLGQEQANSPNPSAPNPTLPSEPKISPIKKLFRKVNVYFLIFLLIVVVAAAVTIVNYLNSKKAPTAPNVQSQTLTQDALKQLANTDATVGSSSQTLTIQGNAVIAGQTLARGNLNVAGNIQSSGTIQGAGITVSGKANLGDTQVNSLQVKSNTAVQGSTTLRDLNVSGATSLSGPLVASTITTSRLILSGNAVLQIPNHISFTGPSPGRSITPAVLGGGGSASVNGSDTTGTININTGAGPVAGCFVHITFHQAFSNPPHVLVSPVGAGAGQVQYYVTRDQSGFSLCTNNAAPAHSVFAFDYFVTN